MTDIHALSGAYAVDALDDLERAQFERHIAGCESCRAEVDSLREAGALLAETVLMAPPAPLRDRVLADIATVRPLPPVLEVVRPSAARRWLPALVAAAAVVTAVGVGGAVLGDRGQEGQGAAPSPTQTAEPSDKPSDDPTSAAQRIRNAGDAQKWTHNFPDGAKATLLLSEQLDEAVIVTENMRPAPDGMAYQLWLQKDGEMVSAGLMPEADTVVPLAGSPSEATAFAISVEPAGGSEEPNPPIAFIKFQDA